MKINEDGTFTHSGKRETYADFLARVNNIPKTSDECYTPEPIYRAILNWVEERYGIKEEEVIRPFWPGRDYQHEDYANKVVVDNPPFSLSTEIINFYLDNNVKFFIFGNGLTLLENKRAVDECGFIFVNKNIKYENGVTVATGFITNLERGILQSLTLSEAIKNASPSKRKAKVERPPGVITSSDFCHFKKERYIPADSYIQYREGKNKPKLYGRGIQMKEGDKND